MLLLIRAAHVAVDAACQYAELTVSQLAVSIALHTANALVVTCGDAAEHTKQQTCIA